jgi:murein DD-endopeptidase MepM/ murein hydrolase activator NlpD
LYPSILPFFLCIFAFPPWGQAAEKLILPTANQALFSHGGAAFYQKVERNFEGEISYPWEGGRYGFVRDPKRVGSQLVYRRFHEGIDIRPVERDANGEPLDVVHAIADGEVVHTSHVASDSNYGRYVVILHQLDGSPYFGLYAHLRSIYVTAGSRVEQGEPIGLLGYTGRGIDRDRAHLHLELNLLLNSNFEAWHSRYFPRDPNRHGLYNGLNLIGIDIARYYLALRANPDLSVADFLRTEPVWYRVAVPNDPKFELPKRYPWLAGDAQVAPAWEISFTCAGVPVNIRPLETKVTGAVLTRVKPSAYPQTLMTKGYVTGGSAGYTLSKAGLRYLDLICPTGQNNGVLE